MIKCIENYLIRQKEVLTEQRHDMKLVDNVFGDDHGQGKFRAVSKLILRESDGKKFETIVMKVGHIDCKKDTYYIEKHHC